MGLELIQRRLERAACVGILHRAQREIADGLFALVLLVCGTFQQIAGKYNFASAIAAKPDGEAERTRDFLASKGLKVDRDLMVARFEAHTGPDRRSELIVFYWEDISMPAEELARRAMKMFSVIDASH